MWRHQNERTPSDRPPTPIESKRMWHQLQDVDKIDAVYENSKSHIIFFSGKKYYVFDGPDLLSIQPLTNLGLPDTLNRIDAAFVWGHNNKTYFISGRNYWQFDEKKQHIVLDYPRSMDIWGGIGYNIDAAFRYSDGMMMKIS